MKVSLNAIKQFTDIEIPLKELVEKINQQLGGVEEIVDVGTRYEGAVIARVVECGKHPNADKLSVCMIDAGQDEYVQVVCGAPNVRAGLYVVWLPPGATVPSSALDDDPFVLGERELRGVMSHGMLASAKELGLGDAHDGILEIDPEEPKPVGVAIAPGVSFAAAFGLNDTIIDIENKMFTHRPDCFGQLGVAREIAGISQREFHSPDWYTALPTFQSGDGLTLQVKNDAHDVVPRFMSVALSGVVVKPSPVWLQAALVRLGSKPINNVVDATNYIMLLTAQPTHAYDYDKLRGQMLGARMAHEGESVTLLNHKSYQLEPSDIVIVDGEGPVGLAGIMGGGESEVSATTTNLVLEVANFDMYTLRRSSMRHGIFTDALTRFNKGQSPLQNPYVLDLLIKIITDIAGGQIASHIFDDSAPLKDHQTLAISTQFINERLGLDLSTEQCGQLLRNVEFGVQEKDGTLRVTPPYWRMDIELPEDIVEEVGRLFGFDKLPKQLPKRSLTPPIKNQRRVLKHRLRTALAAAGANELLTYSFVHEKTLQNAGQDPSGAFKLSNALSPNLQYYRLSVLPSLLEKVHPNIKASYDQFTLFEIGKGHAIHQMQDGLPIESDMLELVYASKKSLKGAPYYRARRYVEVMLDELGVNARFIPIEEQLKTAFAAPFDPHRSALVIAGDGVPLGIVGELRPAIKKAFKLPDYVAGASLNIDALSRSSVSAISYRPLSRYPSTWQDVCFKVNADVSYDQLFAAISSAANDADLDITVELIDIYQQDGSAHRQLTYRITMTDYTQTITAERANQVIASIIKKAQQDCGAEVV